MEKPVIQIKVQTEPFDLAEEMRQLASGCDDIGAVVHFIGICRKDDGLKALELEHYPEMAEKQMRSIVAQASRRWALLGVHIVHRVGYIQVGEPIVLVAVASVHRHPALQAAAFIMDYLKSYAPFWKKSHFENGAEQSWVSTQAKDEAALKRWEQAE